MRISRERQTVLSLKVTAEARQIVERLAATMTLNRGKRHTLTDVMEEAIYDLAKREDVKIDGR